MNRTITIDVTQQDIDQSDQDDCFQCAVALAINRHLKPGHSAKVRAKYVVLPLWAPEIRFREDVSDRIIRVALCNEMTPFSFSLDLPHDCLR